MINFSDFVLIDEPTLKNLNSKIDEVIAEKNSMPIDYNLLETVLGVMLKHSRYRETTSFPTVVQIKKDEMLGLTLDFFKSIDERLYQEAVNTIIKKHNNIKVNIYNIHDIKDFTKENEFGMLDYDRGGSVQSSRGKATVRVPTKVELSAEESNLIDKDSCTLEDLYTLVHEISHLFDLNMSQNSEDIIKGKGKKRSVTRELLGESTAIAFEGMLTEYLLKNTNYPKQKIRDIMKIRTNSSFFDARNSYAKLILAKEKSKNGTITKEYIEDFVRKNNFSPGFAKNMIQEIIRKPMGIQFIKRYALAKLISPTIIRKTREERKRNINKIFARI